MILVVSEGQIAEAGTHAQLMERKARAMPHVAAAHVMRST